MTRQQPAKSLIEKLNVRVERDEKGRHVLAFTLPEGYEYNNIRLRMTDTEYDQFKEIINGYNQD
jgi:hypothetical protein